MTEPSTDDGQPSPAASSAHPPRRWDRTALGVAERVLLRVEEGAFATLALSGELERGHLDARARGLCTELVYGTLRKTARIDRVLATLTRKGGGTQDTQVQVLLRLGIYQLLQTRIAPGRAVDDVVTRVRVLRGAKVAGFVNAVLRRLAREGLPADPVPTGTDAALAHWLHARHGLPLFVTREWIAWLGQPGAHALCEAMEQAAPTWLRLSTVRGTVKQARARLHAANIVLTDTPGLAHCPEAARLAGGFPFDSVPYGEGWFVAQDLGAQLVARLLLADAESGPLTLPPGALLDACTGLVSKATHLAALLTERGDPSRPIDAVDKSARKLELGRDHLHRLGCGTVNAFALDLLDDQARAAALRPGYAAILLDAPCSGSGVFRRHPEGKARLTAASIDELQALQWALFSALAPHLAPGGVLVYSVCSLLHAEGPALAQRVHRELPWLVPLPAPALHAHARPGHDAHDPALRGALTTLPHRDEADGFFAMRFVRRDKPGR